MINHLICQTMHYAFNASAKCCVVYFDMLYQISLWL